MSRRHTPAVSQQDKKFIHHDKKNELTGRGGGRRDMLVQKNLDTVQIVVREWLKNWIRRRIGRWLAQRGRGWRREGMGQQKRILRLLADLGKVSQHEPNTRTQRGGHVPGTTGKSGVVDDYKVELALPQLSTALNWLTSN